MKLFVSEYTKSPRTTRLGFFTRKPLKKGLSRADKIERQSFNQEVMRPWVQIPAELVIKIVGTAL
jgi:hypothetical protein